MTRQVVALSGDCMVTRGALIGADPAASAFHTLLRDSDFAFTNLEVVPSAGRGHPVHNPASGGGLIADARVLDEAAAAGFSVFGCANNHALDMGTDGVLGTIEQLSARRLPFAGIGVDLPAARRPAYVDGPHGSLALISCSATLLPGQEAAAPSPDLPGRPGLNPLRHSASLQVTAEQMAVLREIDAETGLRARRAEARSLLGIDPAIPGPDRFTLSGTRFRVADDPGFTTECDPRDLEEISLWVREARGRADLVLVSVHSHEPGPVPERPAEFLRVFAHRMIDEGADMVVGHGSHALRGVELYRQKPIFYSLGNIVSQIELSERVPAEDYAQMADAGPRTPGRHFAKLSGHGRKLFAPHQRYWESVVPVLTFEDAELVDARLHAVELGFGESLQRRGRPRLAGPAVAQKIVAGLAGLAASYDTSVTMDDDGVGELVLGGS